MNAPEPAPFRLPSMQELSRIAMDYGRHRISLGETVGVFKVKEILSHQGNVSTVYFGEATVDVPEKGIQRGWRYIIKGIPFRPSTSSSTNARNLRSFFNEIRVLPHVPNPRANHVVRLVDANGYPSRGKLYMALEELAYQSIREKYPDKRLDPDIVLGFARALSRALMHLHSLGIVHGDIKPDNFMIDMRGTAVLVDFGSAFFSGKKSTSRKKQIFTPDPDDYREAFTPLYCSPELARYKLYGGITNPKDEASDAWAFGVTLWELLAGERPFSWMKDESLNKILEDIGRGVLPIRSDTISNLADTAPRKTVAEDYRFLQHLIERLLTVDPIRRLSCFEAHGEILSFCGAERKSAPPATAPDHAGIDRLAIARKLAQLDEPFTTPASEDTRKRGRSTAAIELKTLELRDAYLKAKRKGSTQVKKGWFAPPSEEAPAPPAQAQSADDGPIPEARPDPVKKPSSPKAPRRPMSFEEFARQRKEGEIRRMKDACEKGADTQWGSDTRAGGGTRPGSGASTSADDLAETAVDADFQSYLAGGPGDEGAGDSEGADETRVDPAAFRRRKRRDKDPEATRDE